MEEKITPREAWARLADEPSPSSETLLYGVAGRDTALAAGGFADLDREAERIRRDAPRRLAAVEEFRRQQREREIRHARLAAMQPPEQVLADPGYGTPSPGWQALVDGAYRAIAGDHQRDRSTFDPEVVRHDPESSEEERRRLGGTPTTL